jgi:tetratricopeptide (TPR) repeat protein
VKIIYKLFVMKKTIFLLALLFAFTGIYAQKGKVTTALNFKDTGKLDKAVEAIEEAVDPSNEKAVSSIPWPRTWEVRGEIYQAVFQSKDPNIKKLSDDPLGAAFESYKKALELDEKGRNAKSIKIKLTLLTADLTNQAVDAFNNENYEKALNSFEQILEMGALPAMKPEGNEPSIDTVIIYNAGLAAYNAEKYDEAIKYYKEAAKYKYNGARTHQLVSSSYISKHDTLGALEALKEGLKEYPDNSAIMVDLINIYLIQNQSDEAMKYLDMAISQDPENATFHFALGTLYDKLERFEDSKKCYEKAIELKSDYFDAYYNLGALFFNRGVKQVDVANAVPANEPERYEKEKEKANVEFLKAIPYMEKAHECNPKDRYTLESLKALYYRQGMVDKQKEVEEKLKNLE